MKKPKKIKDEQIELNKFPEMLYETPAAVSELPPDLGADISDDWLTSAQELYTDFEQVKQQTPLIVSAHIQESVIAPHRPYFEQKNTSNIQYSFDEENLINEIKRYIDATYQQHYSGSQYQATDIIIDAGHGMGFTLGNVIKYAKRYGKKQGFNRQDLLKMIHYGILALAVHDRNEKNEKK